MTKDKAIRWERNLSNLTTMQLFAGITVGLTTIGACIAAWQLHSGSVGATEWLLLGGGYFATAIGIEVGFHRYFSHSAFQGSRAVTWIMGVLGSMAAQGPLLFWVATHRKHHAFTDQESDPHSPNVNGRDLRGRVHGLFHAHVGWLFDREQARWARFAPDLLRRREIMVINRGYLFWLLAGIALPTLVGGLAKASWQGAFNGLIWGGLFRIFLLSHVTWAVNSVCHTIGRQPHKVNNNSRNLYLLCIPSVGGSFHNNHHAYPVGARNDHQSWLQLDLSGLFIEMLGKMGLAKNIRRYRGVSAKNTLLKQGDVNEQYRTFDR